MNTVEDGSAERGGADDEALLRKTYIVAQWRILPILFCLWMLAWVDRSNIAFAKLQMLGDLKFGETTYGFGAGLFYVGYVVFGVPTSLVQKRYGARWVLSGLAVCWGLTSFMMTFVHTASQFYVLRLLLGVFEAGFYPGVILYFNTWFAGKRRARNFSIVHSGSVCSTVAVGLTGGYVLEHISGAGGFEGWRWMFLGQAVPTVLLALVAFFMLADRPDNARWLSQRQRTLINEDLRDSPELLDNTSPEPGSRIFNSSIWILTAAYFSLMVATTAIIFFAPTILREAGFGGYRGIGAAVAGTCILGALGNILISTLGGDAKRRQTFCALAASITAVSLLILVFVWHSSTVATFIALTLGFAGTGAGITLFWQLSVGLLDRKATIIGVPFINSVGCAAGFFTPFLISYMRDMTGSYMSGFVTAACVQALGVLVVLFGVRFIIRRRSRGNEVSLQGVA